MANLFSVQFQNRVRRFLGRRPRSTKPQKEMLLGQLMEQFELEMRWVPAILTVGGGGQYATIQAAIDSGCATPGSTIQVASGTYPEWVHVPGTMHDVTIEGNNDGIPGCGTRNAESIITAPSWGVEGYIGGANDIHSGTLFSVDPGASGITISGFKFEGAAGIAPSVPMVGTIQNGSATIDAIRGIDVACSTNCITISDNIIGNVADSAVRFDQTSGGCVADNWISNYGFENGQHPVSNPNPGYFITYPGDYTANQPWSAVYVGDNSVLNVVRNTVNVPSQNHGIVVENVGGCTSFGSMQIACNTITVGNGSDGIFVNLIAQDVTGSLNICNNNVTADSTVHANLASNWTRGIDLWDMTQTINGCAPNYHVNLFNNTIGGTGNTFDIGMDVWNTGSHVNFACGTTTVGNAAIGVEVDAVNPNNFGNLGTANNYPTVLTFGCLTVNAVSTTTNALKVTSINQPVSHTNAPSGNVAVSNVSVTVNGGSLNAALGGNSILAIAAANGNTYANVTINDPALSNATLQRSGTLGSSASIQTNRAVITDTRANHLFDFGSFGTAGTPTPTMTVNYGGIYQGITIANNPSYGWVSAANTSVITTGNGSIGDAPTSANKDIIYGTTGNGTFRLASEPAGDYTITVTVGAACLSRPQLSQTNVTLNVSSGTPSTSSQSAVTDGKTAGNSTRILTFNVSGFTGGNMDFVFTNNGNAMAPWTVDAMTVTKTA